ncbi:hypothetical protein ONZ45_g4419 [Pleurotus djamor]|nr:hypothetical protein ONZ45_g4419 [Pleurotus djamor]
MTNDELNPPSNAPHDLQQVELKVKVLRSGSNYLRNDAAGYRRPCLPAARSNAFSARSQKGTQVYETDSETPNTPAKLQDSAQSVTHTWAAYPGWSYPFPPPVRCLDIDILALCAKRNAEAARKVALSIGADASSPIRSISSTKSFDSLFSSPMKHEDDRSPSKNHSQAGLPSIDVARGKPTGSPIAHSEGSTHTSCIEGRGAEATPKGRTPSFKRKRSTKENRLEGEPLTTKLKIASPKV